MSEEFKCSNCGEIIKQTDYDYKDYWLFIALKNGEVCEDCLRITEIGFDIPLKQWNKKCLLDFILFIRVNNKQLFFELLNSYCEMLRGN